MSTITRETRGKHLGFSFFAGPVLWGIQLLVGYALANLAGVNGGNKLLYFILNGVIVVIVLIAGILALTSWRELSRSKHPGIVSFDEPTSREEFVAASSIFLSSLFFWLILVTGVFTIFFSAQRMNTMPFP